MTVAYITGDRDALMSFFSDPDKFIAAAPFSYWMASLIILFFGPGQYSLDALIERMWLSKASNVDAESGACHGAEASRRVVGMI